jgi:hypothetical protein
MKRVFAVLACGSLLAGCESFNMSMPSFDAFKPAPEQASVRIESEPAGAEAKGPTGAACRTPCSLALPANGVSNVTVSLQGYLPQTLPVNITSAHEPGELSESGAPDQFRIDPDPVVATLEVAPPPPPPPRKKKPAPRAKPKPRAAAPAPAQQQAAPPPPPAPPPPISGFGPPNPPAQGGFGPPNPPPAAR